MSKAKFQTYHWRNYLSLLRPNFRSDALVQIKLNSDLFLGINPRVFKTKIHVCLEDIPLYYAEWVEPYEGSKSLEVKCKDHLFKEVLCLGILVPM